MQKSGCGGGATAGILRGLARTYHRLNSSPAMVDLNTATVDELQRLPGVDLRAAYDLLLWRPYLTWDEVAYVPGFDPDRAAALRTAGASVGLPPEPLWVVGEQPREA
jgi:hypothetical protein